MNKTLLKALEYLASTKTDGINNAEDIERIDIKASNGILYEAFWIMSHSDYKKAATMEENVQLHYFVAREKKHEKYAILCVCSTGTIKETDLGLAKCKVYFLQDFDNKRTIAKINNIFTPIVKTYKSCPYIKKNKNTYMCTLKNEICLPYFYVKNGNNNVAMCSKEIIDNIKKSNYIKIRNEKIK